MAICINCGLIFKSQRETARFCSGKCRTEYSRKSSVNKETVESVGIAVVEPEPVVTLEYFKFKAPNKRTKSGYWEDENGEMVIRKAKNWYDVPLCAEPIIGKDEPEMPDFMNGRQYFLWRENNFQTNSEGMPVIINPLPKYEKFEYRMGGESSSMWSNR